jgi:hypothetical protein
MGADERTTRERQRVREALALASDRGGALLIEPGASLVSTKYRAVALHAGEYMRLFGDGTAPSDETARSLEVHLEAASKAALDLVGEAQRQLADLDGYRGPKRERLLRRAFVPLYRLRRGRGWGRS